jgi:hypothetical protein
MDRSGSKVMHSLWAVDRFVSRVGYYHEWGIFMVFFSLSGTTSIRALSLWNIPFQLTPTLCIYTKCLNISYKKILHIRLAVLVPRTHARTHTPDNANESQGLWWFGSFTILVKTDKEIPPYLIPLLPSTHTTVVKNTSISQAVPQYSSA